MSIAGAAQPYYTSTERSAIHIVLFLSGVSGVYYLLVDSGRASEEERILVTQYSPVLSFLSWNKTSLRIGPGTH